MVTYKETGGISSDHLPEEHHGMPRDIFLDYSNVFCGYNTKAPCVTKESEGNIAEGTSLNLPAWSSLWKHLELETAEVKEDLVVFDKNYYKNDTASYYLVEIEEGLIEIHKPGVLQGEYSKVMKLYTEKIPTKAEKITGGVKKLFSKIL